MPCTITSRTSAAVGPIRFTIGNSLVQRRTCSAPMRVFPNPRPARMSQLTQSPGGASCAGRAQNSQSCKMTFVSSSESSSITLRRAAGERALSRSAFIAFTAFMAFQCCQELFSHACFRSFHVSLLCELGEADHHLHEKFPCFQITTRCFVCQLSEAGLDLGHILGAILSIGQNFLFSNLSEQSWDPGCLPRAPTGVTRTSFLESRCFRWCFIANLILSITRHWAPPLDRSARPLRHKLLFPQCAVPIS